MQPVNVFVIFGGVIDFFEVLGRKFSEGREYRKKRFGRFLGELYYWLGILDTESVQQYHLNINFWTKQEALEWERIIQIKLENMPDTHWSANALVTVSMALGVLSVSAATTLQNSVTKLSNHREIRLWLSKGSPSYVDYGQAYQTLFLESSAATIKLSESPMLLLNLAVVAYLLGFGLYLLYGWLNAVTEPATNFRNIFVFYVAVIGGVLGYIALLWGHRLLDKDRANLHFNLKRRFDTGFISGQEELLEKWTDTVEVLTSSKSEAEKQTARQGLEEVLHMFRYGRPMTTDESKDANNTASSGVGKVEGVPEA